MNFHENLRLPADRSHLAKLRHFIEQQAVRTPASEEEIFDLVQAVDEAATNTIVHGYRNGMGEVEVELEYAPGRITVVLRDQALVFDPTTLPEPDLRLPLHQRPLGGLGVHLIRRCVNEFSHSTCPRGGNVLRLVKYLKDNGGPE